MGKKIGGGTVFGRILKAENGDYYLAGSCRDSVDFDMGPGGALLENSGGTRGYYARYDSAFNFLGVAGLEGTGTSAVVWLAKSGNDKLVIAGNYRDTLDLNPGPEQNLVYSFEDGMFLIKVNDPVFTPVTQTKPKQTETRMKVWPNPSSGIVYIEGNEGKHISVKNAVGQEVYRSSPFTGIPSLNLQNLHPGFYWVYSPGLKPVSLLISK
jgi:hypothetical protein